MCLFRKRKNFKVEADNPKYRIGERVNFRYRGELRPGFIYGSKDTPEGVVYSVQIGGECPAVIENIKESEVVYVYKK